MGTFSRQEIIEAFEHYQGAAFQAGQSQDWTCWSDCFTEDAVYVEHLYGRFEGRAAIHEWIQSTMTIWPNSAFTSFPIEWYVVDEQRGWVICQVWNRLEDPGDGSIHQEYNITVLHYAGNGKWSYEEDVYNPAKFGEVVGAWIALRKELAANKEAN